MARRQTPKPPESSGGVAWGVEIEFYNKPSEMFGARTVTLTGDHVTLTLEDGTEVQFAFKSVARVLSLHSTKVATAGADTAAE